MYIYESHIGFLYTSDDKLSYDQRHCETCSDTDWEIGYAETRAKAWELLEDYTDVDGSGGYDYNYVQEFIKDNWEK